jgi:hypothetical protein
MSEGDAETESFEEAAGITVRDRYGLVLLLLLAGYLLGGFEGALVRFANAALWTVVLLTALWAPGLPPRLRKIGVIMTGALFVAAVTFAFTENEDVAGVLLIMLGIAQILAVLSILARISKHRSVNVQTVMGAIAGYALIGFVMAAFYHGGDLLSDTPFLFGVSAPGDYLYFSFVTLTTVGFGDITAASELAKRLVVIEALSGQIFLITLVARLVSLWGRT